MEREVYAYTLNEIGEGVFKVHRTFEKALSNIKHYHAADVFRSYFYIEALYTDESTEKVDLSSYIEVRLRELSDDEVQKITKDISDGIALNNKLFNNGLRKPETSNAKIKINSYFGFYKERFIRDEEKEEMVSTALAMASAEYKQYYWK